MGLFDNITTPSIPWHAGSPDRELPNSQRGIHASTARILADAGLSMELIHVIEPETGDQGVVAEVHEDSAQPKE